MEISKCCGAKIIFTDICSECREHTNVIEEQRDLNIRRSSTVHYPDWDIKNKEYTQIKRRK